jgi:hypothetical protein
MFRLLTRFHREALIGRFKEARRISSQAHGRSGARLPVMRSACHSSEKRRQSFETALRAESAGVQSVGMKAGHAFVSISLLLAVFAAPAAGWVKGKKSDGSFGLTAPLSYAFRGAVYDMLPQSTALPDFTFLKPVGYIYTYALNVPTRFYGQGMPGVTDRIEWFAIDYEADFWISKPGKYRFTLTSDDGSRLEVDGKLVIDNDGVHQTLTIGGSVVLEAGSHHIHVSYFQGPRDEVALVLEVAAPGEEFHVFDLRDFRPGPATRTSATPVDAETRPQIRRDPEFRGSAALKGYEVPAFEALKAQSQPHAFDFRSAAFHFPDSDFTSKCVLAFEVPGTAPTATPAGPGKSKLHVVLLALVKDAGGKIVEKASQDFQAEVTDKQLAALRTDTLSYAAPVTLPPGRYTVETVALDREAGRASTGTFQIDYPERKGMALSSLVLAQRTEPARSQADGADADPLQFQGQRVTPAINASFPAGAQPFVFFVAYPDRSKTDAPKIGVQFLLDGKEIASQTADLPPADASGAVPMTIGAIAKPGHYELKITVFQGGESAERSVRYSIADR